LHKRSLDKLAALHQRTLETLAVAIDGRDHTTHMHLRRVQFYVRAVGQELKLSEEQLEHLNVAALLHDIGKLAIPDHILLKPGPLSPEEWEKMKTHPVSGAEMLSRMNFPEPVLQIVATHHEKWDGTGYPRGIKGDQIPIGSRILTAVDCLAALASARPYRGALPIDMAMARVSKEEGRS
jgi:putative nucleotidyltransferase with HDIG domain